MSMDQMYRDYIDGFVPSIDISRREDNGHFVAKSCGLEATHWDEATAVSQLNEKIQNGLLKGDIHPGS